MSYLALQGIRLFYERQGDGNPPLVFVHGYACSHADWQPQVDFFRMRQCVVTCDLRGHGASDGDPAHCDIETYGADIRVLLSALELPPAILIGHSMGCRVVLQAYREAPQRVAGLILVDGSRGGMGDPQGAELTTRHMMQAEGYPTMMRRLFTDMFVAGSDPALKAHIVTRALAFPEERGIHLFPRIMGWDARHLDTALCQVAVPVLVLQSTYINLEGVRIPLPPGATTPWLELIRHHVPTAHIVIVSGVGHFPMLEAPEAVNQAMAAFVAQFSP
jgi:pimeloyl-ACP methyl ester carboxylesterase